MMSTEMKYAARAEDVLALVTNHPFAWVVTATPSFSATPLPLRPKLDDAGNLAGFIGHFSRGNSQVEEIRRAERALLLFMGAHGYISASWMQDRTQAPTWNYMVAQFDCRIKLIDDAEGVASCLNVLIDDMEKDRPNAWSMDDMGERATRLARGVVGFHAEIMKSLPVFKLGQDERDDVFVDILAGLRRDDAAAELLEHMIRYNPSRS